MKRSGCVVFCFMGFFSLEAHYAVVLIDKSQVLVTQEFIDQSKVLQNLVRASQGMDLISLEGMKEIDNATLKALIDIVARAEREKSTKGKIAAAESMLEVIKRKPLKELVKITNGANYLGMEKIFIYLIEELKKRYTAPFYLTNFFLTKGFASIERVSPSFEKLNEEISELLKKEILNDFSYLCFLRRIDRLSLGTLSLTARTSSCFSSQGSYYAHSTDTGEVRIWDLQKKTDFVLKAGNKGITAMVFNSPENLLATSEEEGGGVKVWDIQKRVLIKEFNEMDGIVTALAFNHDSSAIACGMMGNTVQIFEIETKHKKAELIPSLIQDGENEDSYHDQGFLFFDTSGNYVIIVRKELLQIWDIERNQSRGDLYFLNPDNFYDLLFSCRASLNFSVNTLKKTYNVKEIREFLTFGKKSFESWRKYCPQLFNNFSLKAINTLKNTLLEIEKDAGTDFYVNIYSMRLSHSSITFEQVLFLKFIDQQRGENKPVMIEKELLSPFYGLPAEIRKRLLDNKEVIVPLNEVFNQKQGIFARIKALWKNIGLPKA